MLGTGLVSKLKAATASGVIDGQRETAVTDSVDDKIAAARNRRRSIPGGLVLSASNLPVGFKKSTALKRIHLGSVGGPPSGVGSIQEKSLGCSSFRTVQVRATKLTTD